MSMILEGTLYVSVFVHYGKQSACKNLSLLMFQKSTEDASYGQKGRKYQFNLSCKKYRLYGLSHNKKKQALNPQKGVSGTHSFNFGFGRQTTVLNYSIHLWVGQSNYCTKLWVWQSDYSTEFLVEQSDYTWIGFGSQTTVLNFGLGSRTISVTSWRSESSNKSWVVLDKLLF